MWNKRRQPDPPPRWDTPSGATPQTLEALPIAPEGANYVYHRIPMHPTVTLVLIAINVVVFIAQRFVPSISVWGSSGRDAILANIGLYRLLTATFLHLDALHLISNMYSLFVFGTMFERYFGHRRLLLIYLSSGVGGCLLSAVFTRPETLGIGASGAIFGLAAAFILCYQGHSEVLMAQRRGLLYWTILSMGYAFIGGWNPALHIDNWGHLGGIITGVIIASRTARYYNFHFKPDILRPDALIEYFPVKMRTAVNMLAAILMLLMLTTFTGIWPTPLHANGMTLYVPGAWVAISRNLDRYFPDCAPPENHTCITAIYPSFGTILLVEVSTSPDASLTFNLNTVDAQFVDFYAERYTNFSAVSREDFLIWGHYAIRRTYSDGDRHMSYVIVANRTRLFQFFCYYGSGDYERYRDRFEQMIMNMRFDAPT